jgi:nucleoid-associated protein YgaU
MPSNPYEFWLSYNNSAERLQLPVNPGEIEIDNGSQNTTLSISRLGEVTIIQDPVLKIFEFSSFFPVAYGPFCSNKNIPEPWAAVQIIERWKNTGWPIRFIVTGTPINFPVTIEDFIYKEQGGDVGTIYYDISLKEYRFIVPRLLETTAVNGQEIVTVQQASARPDTKLQASTYTVRPGDSLWKIAKLEKGDGAKYKDIATTNGIMPPYAIYPGQVIKLL